LHEIFDKDFHESEFCKTCFPFIKRYFDYKDLSEIVETFVPTLSYDIRGIYFVPMRCSYSKIIYLLPRDNPMNQRIQTKTKNETETKNKNYQTIPLLHSENEVNDDKGNHDKGVKVLRIMKTMKPDVYEVYSEDMNHLKKLGLALVQTKECSQILYGAFRGKSQTDEVRMPCTYNDKFKKWCPVYPK